MDRVEYNMGVIRQVIQNQVWLLSDLYDLGPVTNKLLIVSLTNFKVRKFLRTSVCEKIKGK